MQGDHKSIMTMRECVEAEEYSPIKICFTCCDQVYHEHRWRWTAWLCGKIQYLRFYRVNMSDLADD